MSHSGQGNEPQPHAHEGVVLPASGEPWVPGQQATPATGQPWGQPWGPDAQQPEPYGQQEQQPEQQPQVYRPEPYRPPEAAPEPYGQEHRNQYQQPEHYQQPQQYQQPEQYQQPQQFQQPQPHQLPELRPRSEAPGLPPAVPQPQPLPSEETQLLSAPQAPADSEATQYIAPIAGGPLPPEQPAESTRFLGLRPAQPDPGAPLPPEYGQDAPDSDPTQYIPPVPAEPGPSPAPPPPGRAPFGIRPGRPGDRQPPAEFDGLFREGPGQPAEGPDSTQQLPRFDGQQPPHGGPHGGPYAQGPGGPQQQYQQHQYEEPPQGRAARRSAGRRRLSPLAVAGMVLGGCIVAGLAAGAAISGGEDDEPGDDKQPVAASEQASESAPPAADPAEKQAKALDALLADSNDSRSKVISAVKNIGVCKDLSQAATDLRKAAEQRNALVTRLSEISIDELPGHEQLTASLNSAWKASAAADNHYAAWADQAAGKKGCKKGKAKHTGKTAAGNKASGEATAAKKKAAGLWNPIAKEHGLTERQYIQL